MGEVYCDEVEVFDCFEEFNVEPCVTSEDTSIEVEVINDSDGVNDSISDSLSFPCILIAGIETEEEVTFFSNRKATPFMALPLYLNFHGLVKRIGEFELSLDNLLRTRSVGNYSIKLGRSADDFVDIDVNEPNTLLKFIKL